MVWWAFTANCRPIADPPFRFSIPNPRPSLEAGKWSPRKKFQDPIAGLGQRVSIPNCRHCLKSLTSPLQTQSAGFQYPIVTMIQNAESLEIVNTPLKALRRLSMPFQCPEECFNGPRWTRRGRFNTLLPTHSVGRSALEREAEERVPRLH